MSSRLIRLPTPQPSKPRTHPAYGEVFSAYALSGRSPTQALRLAAEFWDAEAMGSDLPDRRTVTRWVQEDDWDAVLDHNALAQHHAYRQVTNARLIELAPLMIQRLAEIALSGDVTDPKSASVMQAAAFKLLNLAAAGILETRYGKLPIDDPLDEEVAVVAKMTADEVRARRAARGEEEWEDDAA